MTDSDQILQKVSSGQDVILVEVRQLRDSHLALSEEFQIHRRDDREDFNRVFSVMEQNRQDRNTQFGKVIDALVRRMDAQDAVIREQRKLIDAHNTDADRAKGAGATILGFLGFIGGIVIAFLGALFVHWLGK